MSKQPRTTSGRRGESSTTAPSSGTRQFTHSNIYRLRQVSAFKLHMAKEKKNLNLLIAANQTVKKDSLQPWKYIFLTNLFTNLENTNNLL